MAARRRGQRRDASKERHWRRALRDWRRSGLSVREFCDWQNLSEPSFFAWRRELAKRDREASAAPERVTKSGRGLSKHKAATTAPPAFVPVRVVADEPREGLDGKCCLELRLPTGVQLRVPAGFDRQTLADVFAALENRPC